MFNLIHAEHKILGNKFLFINSSPNFKQSNFLLSLKWTFLRPDYGIISEIKSKILLRDKLKP